MYREALVASNWRHLSVKHRLQDVYQQALHLHDYYTEIPKWCESIVQYCRPFSSSGDK